MEKYQNQPVRYMHSISQTHPDTYSRTDESLNQEDWSFAELTCAQTSWGPHGYHRYPAKFIPQMVHRIIERYSSPNERVGDPFLGSATTGIEALRTGRHFHGSDIHPVALLISRAKCMPIQPHLLATTWRTLDSLLITLPQIGRRPLKVEEIEFIQSINIARATTDERFAYWFPETHRNVLFMILQCLKEQPEEMMRIFEYSP